MYCMIHILYFLYILCISYNLYCVYIGCVYTYICIGLYRCIYTSWTSMIPKSSSTFRVLPLSRTNIAKGHAVKASTGTNAAGLGALGLGGVNGGTQKKGGFNTKSWSSMTWMITGVPPF
jgi:hypothetical protein